MMLYNKTEYINMCDIYLYTIKTFNFNFIKVNLIFNNPIIYI